MSPHSPTTGRVSDHLVHWTGQLVTRLAARSTTTGRSHYGPRPDPCSYESLVGEGHCSSMPSAPVPCDRQPLESGEQFLSIRPHSAGKRARYSSNRMRTTLGLCRCGALIHAIYTRDGRGSCWCYRRRKKRALLRGTDTCQQSKGGVGRFFSVPLQLFFVGLHACLQIHTSSAHHRPTGVLAMLDLPLSALYVKLLLLLLLLGGCRCIVTMVSV